MSLLPKSKGKLSDLFPIGQMRCLQTVFATFCILMGLSISSNAQIDVNSCPTLEKRSNGNGQAALAPGTFPGYGISNPVAPNVVGTTYQTVPYDPATKTGNLNFKWPSATPVTNLPVITRTWLTVDGTFPVTTLSPIKFGPPPPVTIVGQNYYASYSFYVQNMPPAGKVTLEFSDPQTGRPVFTCTYDLQSNGSTTTPSISCAPTISTQPVNANVCGASSASFTVQAIGAASYQWQINNSGNWTNVTNGGSFSGATSNVLTVANPENFDGKQFRVVVTGSGSCGNATSSVATLTAKPKPTAQFAASGYCGTGSKSLALTLTGTAPWTITYTATPQGGSPTTTTVSNILSSPYYFSVEATNPTTYTLTNVVDAYCSNTSFTSSGSTVINALPTVSPTAATACYGNTSFNLSYTSTGSPDQYSISSGVRAMTGFNVISNASLTGSPLSITIPGNIPVGTYDFNMTVRNSSTGCVSAVVPFTVTVRAAPAMGATASATSVCVGGTTSLTASPSGLSAYSWKVGADPAVISTSQAPSVTISQSATYSVTGTDSYGCTATASVSITAVAGPTLTVTPSAPSICSGNAVSLSVSGGNTYSWSPATNLSATTGDLVVASPTTTTTYTVTSQNITGCQSSGTVTVTVNTPAISVTPSATICAGSIKTLTASGGSTYKWYPATGLYTNAGATVAYVAGSNATTVYAKPTTTTQYYVEGTTSGGCSAIATTTVTISAVPVDAGTTTASNIIFCTQGTTSFPLTVNLTVTPTSLAWYYSSDGITYTQVGSGTPTGVTLATSSTGATNTTLTLSGYGSSGYGGPRYFRLMIGTSTCNYNYDVFVTDTKAASSSSPAPAPTASSTTICSGNSVVLSVGTLASGSTVQWQSSADNSSWTNISGATSSSYTATPVANTYYRTTYNSGSCAGVSFSTLITVASAPSANTLSPATSCSNGSSAITLDGSTMSGTTYQWQRSTTSSSSGFTDILGATSEDYTLAYNIVPTTYYFRRIAYPGNCTPTTSSSVAVYAPLSNNQISNTATSYCVTAGATVLNGTTPAGGSGTYTYQWKQSTDGVNFSNISGATSASYTTISSSSTLYYQRVVASGGCSDASSIFAMPVYSNPTVTVTASSSNICAGVSTVLTASGANSYSWSPSADLSSSIGTSVAATSATSKTYTVTGTDLNGCTASAQVSITVVANPADPTLSSGAQTICTGSVNLATLVSGGGTTEWYRVPEVKSAYLVADPVTVNTTGNYYVFSRNGSCYSAGYKTFTLSVADVSKPPVSATALDNCAPTTADLRALQPEATSGVSFEWHSVATNPVSGTKITDPSAVGNGTYYLYRYAAAGSCYGAASDAVTVNIYSLPSVALSSNTASVCAPSTVDLNVYNTTPGTNSYSWYSSNQPTPENLISNPSQVAVSGTYYLAAISATGCRSALNEVVNVTIGNAPSANISVPASVCSPSGSSISGSSNANSPTYQWSISNNNNDWSPVPESAPYSGATSAQLSIADVDGLNGYFYRYSVTDNNGCGATSNAVVLVVETTPVITSSPANVNTIPDNPATFAVNISANPTASVQWQVSTNGVDYNNISDGAVYYGTTSTTLVVKDVSLTQNGYKFRAKVYNSCEAGIFSTAATLAVVDKDSDGDGVPDAVDLDDDNDGTPDTLEGAACSPYDYDCDSDGDGIHNRIDLDSDNDGIPDVVENGGVDVDGDGRLDNFIDVDGDGLNDHIDGNLSGAGSSGQGLGSLDNDGDGIANAFDLDSDGDGIPDVAEAGGTDGNNDGKLDSFTDADSDGFNDSVDGDVGNDGTSENGSNALITTGADANNDGKADSYPNANADASGLPNFLDLDSDNDGITDVAETGLTDSNQDGIADGADANHDGWSDTVDALPSLTLPNTDSKGWPNYLDLDSDDDGIADNIEAQTTAGYIAPSGADADSDGIDDAYDTMTGSYGGNGLMAIDTDNDGVADCVDTDSDDDGRIDRIEGWDSNGNGIIDGSEIAYVGNTDSDNDGILDEYDKDDTQPIPNNTSTPVEYSDAQKPGGDRDWREVTRKITISGVVINDGNGNKQKGASENYLNGTNSGSGLLAGARLFINFIDAYGKVVSSTEVASDGSFSFDMVPALAAQVKMQLTTNQGTVGQNMPATALPAGWVSTGANKFNYDADASEYNGAELSFAASNSGTSVFLFGLNRKPTADPKTQTFGSGMKTGVVYPLSIDLLSGLDGEDGLLEVGNSFRITTLPPAGDDVTLFYNNQELVVGSVINNYDPDKLGIRFNSNAIFNSNPGTMQTLAGGETNFTYQSIDAAGTLSEPATYSITLTTILPVTGLTLQATLINDKAMLTWRTLQEVGSRKFVVERSSDGRTFESVGEVKAVGNSNVPNTYSYTDPMRANVQYYRVKAFDANGKIEFSNLVSLRIQFNTASISVYPNPATSTTWVSVPEKGSYELTLLNASGVSVLRKQVNVLSTGVSVPVMRENRQAGMYLLMLKHKETGKTWTTKLMFQ